MSQGMKVGDFVEYRSVKTDRTSQCTGRIADLQPEGIPSCREPMLKIEGKPGYVLVSHCKLMVNITDKLTEIEERTKLFNDETGEDRTFLLTELHKARAENAELKSTPGYQLVTQNCDLSRKVMHLEAMVGKMSDAQDILKSACEGAAGVCTKDGEPIESAWDCASALQREHDLMAEFENLPEMTTEAIALWLEGLSRRKDCPAERRYWYEGVASDIRVGVWKNRSR